MKRAVSLARRGVRVSPNPKVGCVLVKNGRVVAEGWHAKFGGPHAEAVALARAGARARGATAYVTLEPCGHDDKKTPPCVPALLKAGVRRVVVGMRDPNPKVSGRGIQSLRRARIRVEVGLLAEDCARLNREFLVRMKTKRPYVILKAGVTLDGRTQTAAGDSKWITSPEARAEAWKLRTEVDAILVGSGTVRADDPELSAHGAGRDPLRVVLAGRLGLPRRARVLDGSAPTVVAAARADRSAMKALGGAAFLELPDRAGRRVDLSELLRVLGELGVASLLVEGGSRVHTSFLESGLVDEVRLFVAPKLVGGAGAPSFFEGAGIARLSKAIILSDLHARRVGPDLAITGYLN
ncbi:MAG: bifunctional diaminohydroxyphosphoribosylaminopyrimidine deaminase/5-amino-6-(5-phosphoribosylamino)uracil reductase RibD [Proteobacteria bacterium]|nr:bifunctional diaminohydroxyphosphoribosylaminopyrimidine deaminase/5-amino-6-(5-phosphoribosylamino)uracil reductase RibD [Pseudomonadota bacterium]